jgi:hypothetical protein
MYDSNRVSEPHLHPHATLMVFPPPCSTNDVVVASFFAFVTMFSHIRQLRRRNQTRRQSCTTGAMGYCVRPRIKGFARRLTMNRSSPYLNFYAMFGHQLAFRDTFLPRLT